MNKLNILYYEQNKIKRKVRYEIFRKFFKEIFTCYTNKDCIEILKDNEIKLIIMSEFKPITTCYELIHEIRAIDIDIPIYISGSMNNFHEEVTKDPHIKFCNHSNGNINFIKILDSVKEDFGTN